MLPLANDDCCVRELLPFNRLDNQFMDIYNEGGSSAYVLLSQNYHSISVSVLPASNAATSCRHLSWWSMFLPSSYSAQEMALDVVS